MRELREKFFDYVGDRGPILLQWVSDAFAKITSLRFHELEADEIAFFVASAVIAGLGILKLARVTAAPSK